MVDSLSDLSPQNMFPGKEPDLPTSVKGHIEEGQVGIYQGRKEQPPDTTMGSTMDAQAMSQIAPTQYSCIGL